MNQSVNSALVSRGEVVIQRPNGQRDVITPVGGTQLISPGSAVRNSMGMTASVIPSIAPMGNSSTSYAFIGGPSFPQPSITYGNQRNPTLTTPITVAGVPVLRTSTIGGMSNNGVRSIHPRVIAPLISSNSQIDSVGSGIPISSSISNYGAQMNLMTPSDQAMLASVQHSAYGKRITTTLPADESSSFPPLQPSQLEQGSRTTYISSPPIHNAATPTLLTMNGLGNERSVVGAVIDADPITPGYQAQPGVLAKVGPSIVVGRTNGVGNWGISAWLFPTICLLLMVGLLLIGFNHLKSSPQKSYRTKRSSEERFECISGVLVNGRCVTCPSGAKWDGIKCTKAQTKLSSTLASTATTQPSLKPSKTKEPKPIEPQTKPIQPEPKVKVTTVEAISGASQPSGSLLPPNINTEPQFKKSTVIPHSIRMFSKEKLERSVISPPSLQEVTPSLFSTKPINMQPTFSIDSKPDQTQSSQFVSNNIVKVPPIIKKWRVPVQYGYTHQIETSQSKREHMKRS